MRLVQSLSLCSTSVAPRVFGEVGLAQSERLDVVRRYV